MKRVITSIVTVMVLFSLLAVPVLAADKTITIVVDGQVLSPDVPLQIVDGRTLVPVRFVAEALGAEVNWDGKARMVTINKEQTYIKLFIGNKVAVKNDVEVQLDVPAGIIKGRTMVPIRFISENLGCEVSWEASSRTVMIKSSTVRSSTPPTIEQPTSPTTPTVDLIGTKTSSTMPSFSMTKNTGLLPGKTVVIVTLNTDEPQQYNVVVGGVKLNYNENAKKFAGEVDAPLAVDEKVVIQTVLGI